MRLVRLAALFASLLFLVGGIATSTTAGAVNVRNSVTMAGTARTSPSIAKESGSMIVADDDDKCCRTSSDKCNCTVDGNPALCGGGDRGDGGDGRDGRDGRNMEAGCCVDKAHGQCYCSSGRKSTRGQFCSSRS
jgi:hypothetical protein